MKKKVKKSFFVHPLFLLFLTVASFFLHNFTYALFKFEEPVFFTLTLVSALGFGVSSLVWLIKLLAKTLKM